MLGLDEATGADAADAAALLEAAPAAEASSWTQWLEGRYGFALLDNLVVLLGFPVPAKLKSSILDAIAAFGGGSPTAAADASSAAERPCFRRGLTVGVCRSDRMAAGTMGTRP